jgi:hypothetical protein
MNQIAASPMCDCPDRAAIIRGQRLTEFLYSLPHWDPHWDERIQYVAHCAKMRCSWSEFRICDPHFMDDALGAMLHQAYESGIITRAIIDWMIRSNTPTRK